MYQQNFGNPNNGSYSAQRQAVPQGTGMTPRNGFVPGRQTPVANAPQQGSGAAQFTPANSGERREYTKVKIFRSIDLDKEGKAKLDQNGMLRTSVIMTLYGVFAHDISDMKINSREKNQVSCSFWMNSGAKWLQTVLGQEVSASANGAVKVNAFFLDSDYSKIATGFNKFVQAHAKGADGKGIKITVTGNVSVSDNTGKDGRLYRNVNLWVDEFDGSLGCAAVEKTNPAASAEQTGVPFGNGFVMTEDLEYLL